jgi:hypothetical protein
MVWAPDGPNMQGLIGGEIRQANLFHRWKMLLGAVLQRSNPQLTILVTNL